MKMPDDIRISKRVINCSFEEVEGCEASLGGRHRINITLYTSNNTEFTFSIPFIHIRRSTSMGIFILVPDRIFIQAIISENLLTVINPSIQS